MLTSYDATLLAVGDTYAGVRIVPWRAFVTDMQARGLLADLLFSNAIEYALVRQDQWLRYLLELHWQMLWKKRWDGGAVEDLWADARPLRLGGVQMGLAAHPGWPAAAQHRQALGNACGESHGQ